MDHPRPSPRPHSRPARARAAARAASAVLALAVVLTSSLLPSDRGPGLSAAASPQARLVRAGVADEAGPAGGAASWQPPVTGVAPADVLRTFSAPDRPWGRGHRGVDLAVPSEATIRAPAGARVVFVGTVVDRPVLTLEHVDGSRSSFEPVVADVAVGTLVAAGDPVGRLAGSPAHCDRPCVHWGVRVPDGWQVGEASFDRYLDPLMLIGWSGPSVLWPHAEPRRARP